MKAERRPVPVAWLRAQEALQTLSEHREASQALHAAYQAQTRQEAAHDVTDPEPEAEQ